jgi:hypothetical protein
MNMHSSITDDLWALPRSWKECEQAGGKEYFTGKVCEKCGVADKRSFPRGKCRTCANAENRERGQQKRDAARAEREAVRAAEQAAREEARLAHMAEETTEVVLAEEEAERLAAEEARRERAREKARANRKALMDEIGSEEVKEQERERQREWYARTREERIIESRERRARGDSGYRMIRLRTPPWLTDEEQAEIDAIYASRRRDKNGKAIDEVDHFVPINHPGCPIIGTHVPDNLQVLTPAENAQRQAGCVNEFRCTSEQAEEYIARGWAVWRSDKAADGRIAWSKYAPDDEWREMLEAEEALDDEPD